MDPEKFKEKTEHLLRYSRKLDRKVLAKNTATTQCTYCDLPVTNQVIECSRHRLGTPLEHVKHRCTNCKTYIYDGSIVGDPYALRKPFNYYVTVKDRESGDTMSVYGNKLGRPRKVRDTVQPSKRSVGRPRKNPIK